MTKVYVITEGKTDAEMLKKILPRKIVENIEFVIGSGHYSIQSLARSILATKQAPVAIVLDADSIDNDRIQEQKEFYREILRQASPGTKFEVFLAKPTDKKLNAMRKHPFVSSLSKFLLSAIGEKL